MEKPVQTSAGDFPTAPAGLRAVLPPGAGPSIHGPAQSSASAAPISQRKELRQREGERPARVVKLDHKSTHHAHVTTPGPRRRTNHNGSHYSKGRGDWQRWRRQRRTQLQPLLQKGPSVAGSPEARGTAGRAIRPRLEGPARADFTGGQGRVPSPALKQRSRDPAEHQILLRSDVFRGGGKHTKFPT